MSDLLVPNTVAFLPVSFIIHSLTAQEFASDLLFQAQLQLFSRTLVASLTQCDLLILMKLIVHYLGPSEPDDNVGPGSPLGKQTKRCIAV